MGNNEGIVGAARGTELTRGRALVVAAMLAATLSGAFAAGRLTAPDTYRTRSGAATIHASDPTNREFPVDSNHRHGRVKWGQSGSGGH